jgi:selenide,water dikinase
MSDVYAMGGEVLLALNIAAFPESLDPAILARILEGGAAKVAEAGGVIAGGHTLYDDEPKYGLAVTGTIDPRRIITKAGAQSGDALVLTKPLGTGIVLTAAREAKAQPAHLKAAVESMLALNRHPSHVALEAGVHAMTDVTGFGLLGHAAEIAARSGIRVVIDAGVLPALPGALGYASAGIDTAGAHRNREGLAGRVSVAAGIDGPSEALAYDPQTSGGLLVALERVAAHAMVQRLHDDGLQAMVVGEVEQGEGVFLKK